MAVTKVHFHRVNARISRDQFLRPGERLAMVFSQIGFKPNRFGLMVYEEGVRGQHVCAHPKQAL